MKCAITIDYPHPREEAVEKIKDEVISRRGVFKGDTSKGHFKIPTPFGLFEVKYKFDNDTVIINVIEMPSLSWINCEIIERQVEEYLKSSSYKNNNDSYFIGQESKLKHKTLIKSLQGNQSEEVTKLMSEYLAADSPLESFVGSVPFLVKRTILYTIGDFHTDPNELNESIKMIDNLLYNNTEFLILTIKLNKLSNLSSEITLADVKKCETVGECINLVIKKQTS